MSVAPLVELAASPAANVVKNEIDPGSILVKEMVKSEVDARSAVQEADFFPVTGDCFQLDPVAVAPVEPVMVYANDEGRVDIDSALGSSLDNMSAQKVLEDFCYDGFIGQSEKVNMHLKEKNIKTKVSCQAPHFFLKNILGACFELSIYAVHF